LTCNLVNSSSYMISQELPWSTNILETSWLVIMTLMSNGNFSLGERTFYETLIIEA
jgi:hypothetical protein